MTVELADVPRRSYMGTPATAPGPAGPTMLRHLRTIRADPLRFLGMMAEEHGDVVQFPIPRPPTYLVNSAAGVDRVLVDNARNYGKDTIQYRSLSLVTGQGLLTAPDVQWRRQRPVVQPAFHHRALSGVAAVAGQEADAAAGGWPDGGVVDVEPVMMDIALRTVGRMLFADDLRGSSADLARATISALRVVIQRARVPVSVPRMLPTPANRRLERSTARLDAAVARLVAQRRGAAAGDDLLLDLLLGAGLSPREVRDQVVTFLVAGHETAASGLTWALWLLAGEPRWQIRVAESADHRDVLAVVDEALRLYPPAWVITRRAESEDVVSGRRIPAGALVITSPYLLHRDRRWFPEPERFDPDRFDPTRAGGVKAQRAPGYLPFGKGMRLCIGRDFARWEMAVVLHRLCRTHRFTRLPGPAPRAVTEVTLRPRGGMLLRVSRR